MHDSQALPALLHGNETRVWGDSAYTGQTEAIRAIAPEARDFTQKKASRHQPLCAAERAKNRNKSKVRAKGEHPIGVIKRVFGFVKVCYRGIAKNTNRLFCCLCLGQSVHAAQALAATVTGVVCH